MLYIDIGATFLKFLFGENVTRIEMPKEKIISVRWLKQQILDFIFDKDVEEIAFSCQMHGYVIKNDDSFVTWKNKGIIPDFIQKEEFEIQTGLFLRDDLPISNLVSGIDKMKNSKIKILHISEALLDESNDICSEEMACGTGFYNLTTKEYIYVNEFFEKFNVELSFDKVADIREISGYIFCNKKKIKCYPGIGDMQASLFSLKENQISVNIATGSQISILSDQKSHLHFETRPFFGRYLKCITHIPAGRFLNIFAKLIPNLFEIINQLNMNDLENANISFDLNFEKIKISDITEDNLSIYNFAASLVNAFLKNYQIEKFMDETKNEILLNGGISKKIKLISEFFENKYNISTSLQEFDDDSLLGLKMIF